MGNIWVYRRPFDYRVWRTWIMPAPLLSVEASDTIEVLESVLGGLEGEITLTFTVSDTVEVSENISVLLPVLTILETETVTVAEFVNADTGVLTISTSDTVPVDEAFSVQPIETFEGAGFLTMGIGG